MRRFILNRITDISGISGTGIVAEGVVFNDGAVVINWLTEFRSIVIWTKIEDVIAVHGHGGNTMIEWIDPEEKS